jgi:hypothetical protein
MLSVKQSFGKSISSRARKRANHKTRVQATELMFTGQKSGGADQNPKQKP